MMPRRPVVLFVTYGGGHVNALLPAIEALRERGDVDVRVLGLTTARRVLEARGVECLGFRDLVDPERDAGALEHGRRLAGPWAAGGVVPHDESVAYLGLSYQDLASRLGAEGAERALAERGRQAFLPLGPMGRLFDRLEPDLLVATNSPRAEQAAVETAARRGVPAVCVVDLFGLGEMQWLGRPGYGDRLCVISPSVRRRLVAAGRREAEIEVTGNPAFDRLARPDLGERARTLRRERGWGDDRVILWASQAEPRKHPLRDDVTGDPSLPRRVDAALLEILRRRPDWRLVVRPHPSETGVRIDASDRAELSPPQDDLATLLAAVDVVVTMTSTVGFESCLVGTPVVALGESILLDTAPYAEEGLALGAATLADLEPALERVLVGGWRNTEELPPVGRATERVVAVIDELLTEAPVRGAPDMA